MSLQPITNILSSLILICSVIGVCVSIGVLLLMLIRRARLKPDGVTHLLNVNSYIALCFGCGLLLDMSVCSIYGQLHPDVSFSGWWCRFKGYGVTVAGSMFFYSFLLQAFYRLCRVVFSTQPKLRSFRLYAIAMTLQWILGFSQTIPYLVVGTFEYLDYVFYCQVSPNNPLGTFTCLTAIYAIPFVLTIACYVYTITDVRKRSAALITINQNASTRRDLLVLTRIVSLLTFVATVALPQVIIPLIYATAGLFVNWTVQLGWVLTSFSLALISVVLIFASPHLRRVIFPPNRVEPVSRQTYLSHRH